MIRRATSEDGTAVGDVFVSARDLMTYLPRIPDEDRPKLGDWIVRRHETWLADEDGRVAGFCGLTPGWLDHLYVHPDLQNQGIGSTLLGHAQALQPTGLQLWVFQENQGARRFYERQRFRLVELTDGQRTWSADPTPATSGDRPRRARRVSPAYERTGSSRSCWPRIERAMTSRWISLVPS